jgi:hypothetical protein
METNTTFLEQVKIDINEGSYDKFITMPFMSRNLIYAAIKGRIERRIQSGGTPVLNELEIASSVEEAKETAVTTFMVFMDKGLLEKVDGEYDLTPLGKKLL